ncbi:ABC transporter ATP-binding protein [Apilactobacillus ozensis]|uniref:ATP-binding cassette domain-containing protein n=1 Tax=Apilactobacillus ozensis TaxID=866801 RepID=UPI000704D5E6|nr:ABC transporter ATP-binding protein [Apilactobacillus ozensis]
MIGFYNISKKYNNQVIVHNLNFNIKSGEFFVLIGPSGSGKTTILNMINRLVEPTNGRICIDLKDNKDYDLKKLRYSIGYVLQSYELFPNMNIAQNTGIKLRYSGMGLKSRKIKVKHLLDEVGLYYEKYANKMPSQLSGGEQQRVAIARALSTGNSIVLMDEPFSALDPISRNKMQELILKLHKKYKITIVFVTHDMNEAVKLGDRIAIVYNGNLQQVNTAEVIINNPKNKFVSSFFENYY